MNLSFLLEVHVYVPSKKDVNKKLQWSGLQTNRQQPMMRSAGAERHVKQRQRMAAAILGGTKWLSYSYALAEGEARIRTGNSWKHSGMLKCRASMETRTRCCSQPTPATVLGSLEIALSAALG